MRTVIVLASVVGRTLAVRQIFFLNPDMKISVIIEISRGFYSGPHKSCLNSILKKSVSLRSKYFSYT
jgi:hypothetical protein